MLTITNLTFSYRRQDVLLTDISLVLQPGRIYGLLGKNGAGKSTLLKNMVGLAWSSKGSCTYNGINLKNRPVSVLEEIFFIAEELFLPSLTPVQFVDNTAGFYPKFSRDEFFQNLKVLDVDKNGVMDKQSLGQQKKAMIAFGLATNTNLLIMDEPTNGLDIPSKVQFRKLIASVQTERRCILVSTHQVRDLDNLIDKLLILHDRKIIIDKSLDEIGEKLYFGSYRHTGGMQVLYEEDTIRGKYAIVRNTTGELSKPDIELLFNAVISGFSSIIEILKAS